MAGAVPGTLEFMPPIQRDEAALPDARSDLWSLAATLYRMVTGERPRVIHLGAITLLFGAAFEEQPWIDHSVSL